ncbi:MAG: hypothetical protein U0Z70_23280 [Thermomicrobiales bacterium]
MTECQGCGAWNERHRTLCVLCGTPLAETDEWDAAAELPPLPPLPDGGLSVTMPAWLRAVPETPEPNPPSQEHEPLPAAEPPLGPHADPRTFLRDDDFPRWLRELPALPPRPLSPVAAIVPPVAEPAVLVVPAAAPAPPLDPRPGSRPASPEPAPQDRPAAMDASEPLPVPASSPAEPAIAHGATAHRRQAWETPLLVVLVVGVAVAVIWALFINGIIGGGL